MSFGVDGIIQTSMAMSNLRFQNQLGIAMLKNTMEQQELQSDLLLEQFAASVRRPAPGSTFEVRA